MRDNAFNSIDIRALFAFGAFYFFYFVMIGVYIIYLPQMLKSHGFSATQVGAVYAAAPMMRFILPFVFRRYVTLDERIYKAALTLLPISAVISALSVDSFWLYFGTSLLLGSAMGAVLPYVDTVSLQVVAKERYGKVRLWGSAGFIIIALWMGQMLGSLRETFVYLVAAAFFTMAAGIYLIRFDPHRYIKVDMQQERAFSLGKYWAFWLSAFLLQISFGGFYNFFTIYESSYGFSQSIISYLWSFGVAIEIAMLFFQGPLLKRDLLFIIKLTTFSAIIRWMLLYLYGDSLAAAFISQSLHALSFALYYTATISYVYQLYTQKKLAQQFYLGITFGLGGSLGALLAGWIYDRCSSQLFGIEAFFAMMSFIMMIVHEHRRKKGHELG